MAAKPLSAKDVDKKVAELSGWKVTPKKTQMHKTFEFPNFVAGLAFVAKVTVHAEILEHHPDVELSFGKVKVKLQTHDVGGLTKLDFALAERIDRLHTQ